jgi:quinol-cytochrome oxidoreductase complex cytochrome b subunit
VARYFVSLRIAFHEFQALLGFFIFLTLINQIVTGTMMCLTEVPESMYVSLSREEDSCENLYVDDFLLLHERGVDYLVFFIYCHICRKLHEGVYTIEQELAWKHGALLYLLTHVVIFFGLLLSCTHLSEITLTIVSQILHTLFLFTGKVY